MDDCQQAWAVGSKPQSLLNPANPTDKTLLKGTNSAAKAQLECQSSSQQSVLGASQGEAQRGPGQ